MASALDPESDLPALRRLFTLYDERERCYRSARKGRVVAGSTGQAVRNPLYKFTATLDAEIRQMEDRFGLTPPSRARLGITLTAAMDVFAALRTDPGEDDEDDPRIDGGAG